MSKKRTARKKNSRLRRLASRFLPAYGRIMPEPGGDPKWHPKCKTNKAMSVFSLKNKLMEFRFIRRSVYLVQYMVPCIRVAFFSKDGFYSADGRALIWGKFRRLVLSFFPDYAHKLQEKHGISGGCRSCGASCKLLFQCPHWDNKSHLCSIYEDRPPACRLFPITPADIRDRDILLKKEPCGFAFQTPALRGDRQITMRPDRRGKKATKQPVPIPPKR